MTEQTATIDFGDYSVETEPYFELVSNLFISAILSDTITPAYLQLYEIFTTIALFQGKESAIRFYERNYYFYIKMEVDQYAYRSSIVE